MSDIIQPRKRIKLHAALKIGYLKNKDKQAKVLKRYGYILDRDLSSPEQNVVAYNPTQKKLLYVSNGTNPLRSKDVQTDILLASGAFKQTRRYEEEKNALLKAQEKYKVEPKQIHLAGHSLGGQVINSIAPSGSHAYTFNPAFTAGQKARENVHNYRSAGDIVSILAPRENTTTLGNPVSASANPGNYLLRAHKLENLKNTNIYV